MQLKKISIITGHYGSGKTNIAVNLAIELKKTQQNVSIVDLDIVNPYFRTADFKELLTAKGINVITPAFANTNIDMPSLPASIDAIIHSGDYVVIDVGGDDAGAVALGRYANEILKSDYEFFYVINECRYLTKNAADAVELLREIEAVSRLKATKLINNSNLGEETTLQTLLHSYDFAQKVSELSKLPVAFSCIKRDIPCDNCFAVDIFVKTPWNK